MMLVDGYVDTLAEFLGQCFGVILVKRNDLHIGFNIVVEDDGNWYYFNNGGGSDSYSKGGGDSDSGWLTELHAQMGYAIGWCKEHADPDIYDGEQVGWKVRGLTSRD